MNIAVAVSGGTDSLFALLHLREAGHRVFALHARFLSPPPEDDPVPGLEALCHRLDIPLRIVDFRDEFKRKVMSPFIRAHAEARTPNPCALCNRAMKFGLLLDAAFALDSLSTNALPPDGLPPDDLPTDALATGHYAALLPHPVYGHALQTGADASKDQSYFLALTPIERLRRCIFPLAATHKVAIRQWLRLRGFEPPLPKESQEICFVPGDDHRAFLAQHAALHGIKLSGSGPVLLDDPSFLPSMPPGTPKSPLPVQNGMPVIAQHKGLWHYTEGQRKGLGIAWREPLFVQSRQCQDNALIVAPKSRLHHSTCVTENANFLVAPDLWPKQLLARIRYRQVPAPAHVTVENNLAGPSLRLSFLSPQLPPAPGQVAAVYDKDGFLLAGGLIAKE